jgi:two-component system sensor histidine kinase VicK
MTLAEVLYFEDNVTEKKLTVDGKTFGAKFILFEKNGEFSRIYAILTDFESKTHELAMRDFVANVSHELKTPLATMKIYIETLQNSGVFDETSSKFLEIIGQEGDRMTRIVSDLLTLSKFDSEKNKLNLNCFSLKELIEDIVRKFSMEAQSKGINLTYAESNEMPDILADKDKLERVLQNIISNSLKYTLRNGEINIFSGFLYNEFYIKVHDNGRGIPKKDLPHVFDRFYRVDKARTREMGGTGLGLSIAKEIVENHGGTISITSEYGAFTEVLVKIPLKK